MMTKVFFAQVGPLHFILGVADLKRGLGASIKYVRKILGFFASSPPPCMNWLLIYTIKFTQFPLLRTLPPPMRTYCMDASLGRSWSARLERNGSGTRAMLKDQGLLICNLAAHAVVRRLHVVHAEVALREWTVNVDFVVLPVIPRVGWIMKEETHSQKYSTVLCKKVMFC